MEVSKQIIEVLEYLGQQLGIAMDFSNENIIPYVKILCEKYISWEIATSITTIIFYILIMIFCVFVITKVKNNIFDEDKDFTFLGYVFVIAHLTLFIMILFLGEEIFDILKCVYFPELQLYEYISKFVDK